MLSHMSLGVISTKHTEPYSLVHVHQLHVHQPQLLNIYTPTPILQ